MSATNEISEWVLETSNNIDSKLCEHAKAVEKTFGMDDSRCLKVQEARIELIKAIMEK